MTPASRRTILLIEDDPDIGDVIAELLESEGFMVTRGESLAAGLAALERERFALVITDGLAEHGRHERRWAFVEQIRRAAGATPVIICTAHTEAYFAGALERGFAAVLQKPFDLDDLLALIARVLHPAARIPAADKHAGPRGAAPRECGRYG